MLNNHNPRLIWLITAGSFFSFFVFGFLDNLKGPLLPELLRDLQLNYSQGGTILMGAYIGFLIATLLTGLLADKAGYRVVLILAGIALVLGMAAFSYNSLFLSLFMSMVVLGLGLGAIEVGGNGLIVEIHDADRGRYLNLLAAFHGFGSLLVPLYAAQLLAMAFTWRQIFQISLILAALLTLCFIILPDPRHLNSAPSNKVAQSPDAGLGLKRLLKTGFAWPMPLYYLLILFYVSSEIGLAAWLVEFLQQDRGFSISSSNFYLSFFFGCIVIGRLVGSAIVDRIGYLPAMLYAMIGAIICLLLGHLGPQNFVIFIPITGLFFSIIFPTAAAAVSENHPENTGSILGLLFTFGGLGGTIGPWAMGWTSDWIGIAGGFMLPIGYCCIVIVSLAFLIKNSQIKRFTN